MKIIKRLGELIRNKPKLIVAAGLMVIILLAISSFYKPKAAENSPQSTTVMTAAEYKQELEDELCSAVANLTGGRVKIMITLESDIEYVYLREQKNESKEEQNGSGERSVKNNDSEQNYVIVKAPSGGEEPLIVTAIMPNVKGAVVNCDGGDDPAIREQVKGIVMTALGIGESKVCVTGYTGS